MSGDNHNQADPPNVASATVTTHRTHSTITAWINAEDNPHGIEVEMSAVIPAGVSEADAQAVAFQVQDKVRGYILSTLGREMPKP